MKGSDDKYGLKDFQRIIDLVIKIADKYNDNRAYEAALTGLYVGLNLYEKNKRSTKLDLYLIWFIKTSIEYSLGYKNQDTRVWESKIRKEAGDK